MMHASVPPLEHWLPRSCHSFSVVHHMLPVFPLVSRFCLPSFEPCTYVATADMGLHDKVHNIHVSISFMMPSISTGLLLSLTLSSGVHRPMATFSAPWRQSHLLRTRAPHGMHATTYALNTVPCPLRPLAGHTEEGCVGVGSSPRQLQAYRLFGSYSKAKLLAALAPGRIDCSSWLWLLRGFHAAVGGSCCQFFWAGVRKFSKPWLVQRQ